MKEFLNVALPKGRLGERVYAMFAQAGFPCEELLDPKRKLIFENPEAGVRYFWVKPSDVPVYVERGAADVGVAGKDILLEYGPDIYELLDLNVGKCRMCVAAKNGFRDDPDRTLRVATEFPNITRTYYAARSRDIDIIRLHGSIEIAPILDLTDVIVDIVETGTTLRENDLTGAELFRAEYPEILPGFYCDKRSWIAALLDGDLPDEVLRDLCEQSYRLTVARLPKYVQRELEELT